MPANKIKYKISNKIISLLDLIYPIDAFYINVTNTSPATLFGGTWVAITNEVVLRAAHIFGEIGSDTHILTSAKILQLLCMKENRIAQELEVKYANL